MSVNGLRIGGEYVGTAPPSFWDKVLGWTVLFIMLAGFLAGGWCVIFARYVTVAISRPHQHTPHPQEK